jgi:hypothetical protein
MLPIGYYRCKNAMVKIIYLVTNHGVYRSVVERERGIQKDYTIGTV